MHARVGELVDGVLDVRAVHPTSHVLESRVWVAFLQERSRVEQARPGHPSRIDRVAKRREIRELAAEIEHGGDPCGQEERRGPTVRPEHVHVHVGEPGNHEAPTRVDDLRAFGRRRLRRRTDA